MSKPTRAQLATIDYFTAVADERPPLSHFGAIAGRASTDRVCEREGWIEPTDAWPFHIPTDEGRAVLRAALDDPG